MPYCIRSTNLCYSLGARMIFIFFCNTNRFKPCKSLLVCSSSFGFSKLLSGQVHKLPAPVVQRPVTSPLHISRFSFYHKRTMLLAVATTTVTNKAWTGAANEASIAATFSICKPIVVLYVVVVLLYFHHQCVALEPCSMPSGISVQQSNMISSVVGQHRPVKFNKAHPGWR